MRKLTLFDTPFSKARSLSNMVPPALTFLIKNKDVFVSDKGMQTLSDLKLYSSTSMSKLYQALVEADKLKHFVVLDFTSHKEDVPEILTMDKVVIDGKYIPNIPVPTPIQKCWVNLTPILGKKDAYNGALLITDTTTLCAMFVKAFLVSTYNDMDLWLNPKLSVFVIETYSMTIAEVLTQAYNLDYDEKRYVQTLFATYYAQLLGGEEGDLDRPPLLMRCSFLGSTRDITARLERIEKFRNKDEILTPSKICEILTKEGPARMKKFSNVQLYRYMSSSALDSTEMMIAVDYPPSGYIKFYV